MLCTFMCCFHEKMELRVQIVGKHVICSDSVGQLQWYFYTISWFLTIEKKWKKWKKLKCDHWLMEASQLKKKWKKIEKFNFFSIFFQLMAGSYFLSKPFNSQNQNSLRDKIEVSKMMSLLFYFCNVLLFFTGCEYFKCI